MHLPRLTVQFGNPIVRAEHRVHVVASHFTFMQEEPDDMRILLQLLYLCDAEVVAPLPHLATTPSKTHQRIVEMIADLVLSTSF